MELLKNYPTEILILLFLIVTFLQSGVDKITDWKGNLIFYKRTLFKFSFKKYSSVIIGGNFNCRNFSKFVYDFWYLPISYMTELKHML